MISAVITCQPVERTHVTSTDLCSEVCGNKLPSEPTLASSFLSRLADKIDAGLTVRMQPGTNSAWLRPTLLSKTNASSTVYI